MESIWSKTTEIARRPPLSADISTEAAVIGGGLAGALIAFLLQESGVKTVVLEGDHIGSGQTKNTSAKITSQHGLIYDTLISSMGKEKAQQFADANQEAIEQYKTIIAQRKIDCHLEECAAYLYSTKETELLEKEAEAAKSLGIPAAFTTNTELPFPVKAALKFERQAQFHPLEFLKNIAEDLTVYEQTKVKSVEGSWITTDKGTVTAQHIIFATHYPFVNMPGYYFMRMHQERSYILALEDAGQLHGMYLGVDEDGLSFRSSGEKLLLGGGKHRAGENRSGGKYQELRQKAEQFWYKSREVAHWSAQDCITLDKVPYIGSFSSSTPNWYVATGFGKWGMTTSMVSAMIIRDLITGKENANADVFSPQRFTPMSSAKAFLQDSIQAVKHLTREVAAPPRAEIEALPNGHGGIVECEGEKVGVYKNEEGVVFIVSTKCPHLGCQLEWNPDEKSWDCPCHGSRFDYHGTLIDNPAQGDLKNG